MQRFRGLMPPSEIEISKIVNINDNKYFIDSGPNGWTIIFPNNTTKFKDIKSSAKENLQDAEQTLKNILKNK